MNDNRYLIVGSDGRSHAIGFRIAQDNPGAEIYFAPGNGGTQDVGINVKVPATDSEQLAALAQQKGIGLSIVSPELPLIRHAIGDCFRNKNLLICGPSAAAALNTEGDKERFKAILTKHGIPTAPYRAFSDLEEAYRYIRRRGVTKIVIKPKGLTGGKGVLLPKTLAEARAYLAEARRLYGEEASRFVIEDRFVGGYEVSAMAFVSGMYIRMLPFTQDYKLSRTGNKGVNTGGLGAHTLKLSPTLTGHIHQIMLRVVNALVEEGFHYHGFLYLGLMVLPDGQVMILEANCRLGDPETQPLLMSFGGNFADYCRATALGRLGELPEIEQTCQALGIVVAHRNYPSSNDDDVELSGIDKAEAAGNTVFQAGTVRRNGIPCSNKQGRLLCITATGQFISHAAETASIGAHLIRPSELLYFRLDIGDRYQNQ